jgi:hypothetical protein
MTSVSFLLRRIHEFLFQELQRYTTATFSFPNNNKFEKPFLFSKVREERVKRHKEKERDLFR